jgi:acyl-CoA synthetase
VVAPEWRGRDLVSPLVAESDLPGLHQVIVLADATLDGALALASVEPVPAPSAPRPDPWSVACVLYTSGSTAAPKGVRHSHETLLCRLTAVPTDATSRMLATFPAGHVASLIGLLRRSRPVGQRS